MEMKRLGIVESVLICRLEYIPNHLLYLCPIFMLDFLGLDGVFHYSSLSTYTFVVDSSFGLDKAFSYGDMFMFRLTCVITVHWMIKL